MKKNETVPKKVGDRIQKKLRRLKKSCGVIKKVVEVNKCFRWPRKNVWANGFQKNETKQSRAAVVSEKFSKVSKVFEKVKWDLRNDLPTEIPKLTKPVFKFIIEISKNEFAMEISKKCHAVIAEEVVSEKVFKSVKSYKKSFQDIQKY